MWPRSIRKVARHGAVRGGAGLVIMLSLANPAAAVVSPSNPVSPDELRRDRKMADDLASAIAADAATFEKALTAPQVREQLERALHKKLSNETLQAMAAHAHAEADYWSRYRRGIDLQLGVEQPQPEGRRAPGRAPPVEGPPPVVNPAALPAPKPFETGGYLPVPDRWRILDALGRRENPLDPYNTNTLKGDKPIFGDTGFSTCRRSPTPAKSRRACRSGLARNTPRGRPRTTPSENTAATYSTRPRFSAPSCSRAPPRSS